MPACSRASPSPRPTKADWRWRTFSDSNACWTVLCAARTSPREPVSEFVLSARDVASPARASAMRRSPASRMVSAVARAVARPASAAARSAPLGGVPGVPAPSPSSAACFAAISAAATRFAASACACAAATSAGVPVATALVTACSPVNRVRSAFDCAMTRSARAAAICAGVAGITAGAAKSAFNTACLAATSALAAPLSAVARATAAASVGGLIADISSARVRALMAAASAAWAMTTDSRALMTSSWLVFRSASRARTAASCFSEALNAAEPARLYQATTASSVRLS